MDQKFPKSRKVESEIKNTGGKICTPLRFSTNEYRGIFFCLGGATVRSFKKMEMVECEKEEENNAPIDIDDDDSYDNTDLFCEEDDEED